MRQPVPRPALAVSRNIKQAGEDVKDTSKDQDTSKVKEP